MVTQHLKKVPTVSGITSQAEQAVFSVICRCSPAHRAALFTLLYQHKVQLNTIHFSHHQDDQATLSFALPVEGVTGMRKAISALMQQDLQLCEHHVQQTQVSIVGLGIQSSDRVITELYDYFAEKSLTVRLMTSSEVRISFYVEASLAPQVIRDLHDLFHLAIESI